MMTCPDELLWGVSTRVGWEDDDQGDAYPPESCSRSLARREQSGAAREVSLPREEMVGRAGWWTRRRRNARGCLPLRGTSLPPAGALLPGKRPCLRSAPQGDQCRGGEDFRRAALVDTRGTGDHRRTVRPRRFSRAGEETRRGGTPERPVVVGV